MQGVLDFFAARANTRTPGEIGLRTCEQLVQCFGVRGVVYGEEGQGCWAFPCLLGDIDCNQVSSLAAWAKTVPTPLPGALGPSHVMAGR
jgi:hypothetical protein